MCGIAGMFNVSRTEVKILMIDAWERMKHRGDDSFGVIGIEDDKLYVAKSLKADDIDISHFPEHLDLVVLHNRKKSVGDVSLNLAHPVIHENMLIIHNGTCRDLYDVLCLYVDNDTEALVHLYDFLDKDLDKFNHFLESLTVGVFLIFDLERAEITIYKDSSRSLCYNESYGLFSSEPIYDGEWLNIDEIQLTTFSDVWDLKIEFDKAFDNGDTKHIAISEMKFTKRCDYCGKLKKLFQKDDSLERCVECYMEGKVKKNYTYYSSYNGKMTKDTNKNYYGYGYHGYHV